MRRRLTRFLSALALTGAVGAVAVPAAAAATPPWEPDPASVGTLAFYDSSGAVITSGSSSGTTGPFAAYAVGSVPVRAGDVSASLYYANPDPASQPYAWYRQLAGNYTPYPKTNGPLTIQILSQTHPVNTTASDDLSLDDFEGLVNKSTTAGYQNVIQIRMRTADSANQAGTTYDVADVMIDPINHTWTQIYPAPAQVSHAAGTFVSTPPTRLLDTRSGVGGTTPASAGTVHLQVLGNGPVPASGVSAVVLNVTVVKPAKGGFVTAYQDGATRPTVSNLNFVAGQTVPNLVTVPVGSNGKVALYNGSSGATPMLADVAGYYVSGTPSVPGAFATTGPSRLLDTRSGLGGTTAASAGTVHLQVLGQGGVPATGVSAVVLNVTVVKPAKGGFITAYPDGASKPTASNLNFVAGQTVPNLVTVPVGANGKVALYNGSSGSTPMLADVAGYYLAGTPSAPGAFASIAPARLLDTRSGVGGTTPASAGTVHLQVLGQGGVPATGVSAVVLNVTVVKPAKGGFITAYGDGAAKPTASNLNFVGGQTVPNLVIVPVGANGKVALYNGSSGSTPMLADVAGYFLSGS